MVKIVTLNLDHTNLNYDNCLKKALLYTGKEEPDILAFYEVKNERYGNICDYILFKNIFMSEVDESVKNGNPFGEILLVRNKFRNCKYDLKTQTMAYIYSDKVIAITRQLNNSQTINFLKRFDTTILIDPQNITLIKGDKCEIIKPTNIKLIGEVSKYPMVVTNYS